MRKITTWKRWIAAGALGMMLPLGWASGATLKSAGQDGIVSRPMTLNDVQWGIKDVQWGVVRSDVVWADVVWEVIRTTTGEVLRG